MRVAIVGGGICGLYLGYKLSKKGHSVNIFEKKQKIGNRVCSGLFSERIIEFIPQSRNLIQNSINYTVLHFPKKTITVKFSKKFYVMKHNSLDKLMADLAQKAGAIINLNEDISALPQKFDKIIGCDGAHSFIRKKLNLLGPHYRLGILGTLKNKSNLNYVETWPCHNGLTPHHFFKNGEGFIWKIPRGTEIEYGIIGETNEAKIIFDEFLNKNNISLTNIRSRIIPQGFIIPKNSSLTLCGDAAGLTKPWSGGGVIWGLTAAEILLKTFPDFLNYRRLMKKFFLPRIIFSKIATKIIYSVGFRIPFLLPRKIRMESDFLL